MSRFFKLCIIPFLIHPFAPAAQSLPFTVVIIDWRPDVRERQARAYRAESADHEVLYCVESWLVHHVSEGLDRVEITGVRRDEAGAKHIVRDVGDRCLSQNGKVLPTIHTHSDGNCQASPSDLITIATRDAPFDGVQCGDKYMVWLFARQIALVVQYAEYLRPQSMNP